MSLNGGSDVPMSRSKPEELPTHAKRSEIEVTDEVVMKSTKWGNHVRELVNASLDPMIYALQWAHDPRCMQHGWKHRRVGAAIERNQPVCRLWMSRRSWG